MRTRSAHILPGCPYCNHDHDAAIACRLKPESTRFQLNDAERTAIGNTPTCEGCGEALDHCTCEEE